MLGMQQHQLPTVGYSVSRLCNKRNGIFFPCREKIAERVRQLKYWCINKFGFKNYLDAYKTVSKNALAAKNGLSLISAKGYLLPVLHSHCKKKCGGPNKMANFVTMLSRYCNEKRLSGLKLAINKTINS